MCIRDSVNGGAWENWQTATTATSATFLSDLETRRKLATGGSTQPRIQRRGLAGLDLWGDSLALRALVDVYKRQPLQRR